MEEEKLRILKMLEEGKLSAEEAAKLIKALDKTGSRPSERELRKRWLHVQVDRDGTRTVDIRIPLALLKFGFKFAPHAWRHRARREMRQAERAERRAERMREQIRRKLAARLGSDVDLDEILDSAFEGVDEAAGNGAEAELGHAVAEDFDLDLDKILKMAQSEGFDGKILDVHDEDEGEHVVIKLE